MRDIPWSSKRVLKRWVAVDDSTYDVVRSAARALKLDLKQLK